MRSKKAGLRVIYAVFLAALCLSWAVWLMISGTADTSDENRKLHELKEVHSLEDYQKFPADFEAFFNDRIPFRNELITLKSAADYYLFNTTSSERAAIGKDGWLFFTDVNDGNPIARYQGYAMNTEEELRTIAAHLVEIRDELAERGIEFVIFIAPDKERVYFDKMPEKYGPPAEEYCTKQLVDYLHANTDLRVLYPLEELMAAKAKLSEPIYYKTDTHWNQIGGYIGACALLKELGIQMPAYDSGEITITESGRERIGDLSKMIGLGAQLKGTSVDYAVTGYDTHGIENLGDFDYGYRYRATEGADPRKILVIRDSFIISMLPYLSSQFSGSYYITFPAFKGDLIDEQQPDVIIFECIERYQNNIKYFDIHAE